MSICEFRISHLLKKTHQLLARNVIGRRIREARLKSKPPVSQDDLAGRLAARGIVLDQTAISRIERQERYLMDYEVAAIAKCLKVSVAWLHGEK
jgi:HTH-type transcriptional regulator, cell division transcriptional repressor